MRQGSRSDRRLFTVILMASLAVTMAVQPVVAGAVEAAGGSGSRAHETGRELTGQLLDRFLDGQRNPAAGAFAQASDEFGRPVGLPGLYETANFKVYYETDPSSVNFATDAFAQETGDVFEEVYANEIAVQGWSRPADDGSRGGDNRIDVYMLDLQFYGFASPDNDATCDPSACTGVHGWMGTENDYEGFPPDPSGALRATVAHEFHHLIQFNESASNDGWMLEATATWEESVVYPDIDARTFYIPAFVESADQSLNLTDGSHEYGLYVFMRWLADRFGQDVIRDAWRATLVNDQHSLAGINAALVARGSDFTTAFGAFTADTAAWNQGDFPRDIINGQPVIYPDVPRRGQLSDGEDTTLTLDHTAYAIYPVTAADQMGARVTTPAGVSGTIAMVAVTPSGVRIDIGTTTGGEATAALGETTGAALFAVVSNADIIRTGTDYPADGSQLSLLIDSKAPAGDSGGVACDPDNGLQDGCRIAEDDPIAQAIVTSQSLFPAGAATRVVLATSERFPDALAGAALAGIDGPILFTPFGDTLDTRTASEIARVTGGNGVVLTLGGTAAVTEAAGAQARAAGGDQSCSAPLPSDCRFAGTGREDTAALIAESVVAQNDGDTALIARGDVFADALTGGAFAARTGAPVLLTPSVSPNQSTADFLDAHPEITRIVVLGGESAVDTTTANALGATDRVAGDERTATSVEIARQLWEPSGNGSGGVVLVNVRADAAWQTALSAAVASAFYDAPQIGVENPGAGLSQNVQAYLAGRQGPVQTYGNTTLVDDAQLAAAVAAS